MHLLSPLHQYGGWPDWLLHCAGCHAWYGWVWRSGGHLQLCQDPLLQTYQHDPDWSEWYSSRPTLLASVWSSLVHMYTKILFFFLYRENIRELLLLKIFSKSSGCSSFTVEDDENEITMSEQTNVMLGRNCPCWSVLVPTSSSWNCHEELVSLRKMFFLFEMVKFWNVKPKQKS